MIKRFSYVLLIFLCQALLTKAGSPVFLKSGTDEFIVPANHLEVLADSLRKFTIHDVTNPDNFNKFKKSEEEFPHIVNTKYTYWIKFTVQPEVRNDKRWVLEVLDPHFSDVQLYFPNDSGVYIRKEAGFSMPFFQREYWHKNFVYDVPLNSTSPVTFYIRMESDYNNVFLFKVRTTQYFSYYALKEYYILGIYYGILGIMALYNLLLFFTVKEKFYLYYVLYVLSCALISFSEDGIGFHYLWPETPELNPLVTFYSPVIFLFCFTLYARSFLELPQRQPTMDKFLMGVIALYTIYFVLDLTVFNFHWDMPVYVFPFVVILMIAVRALVEGYRPARFFVLGYGFILVSIFILVLRMNGSVEWDNVFTIYSFNIGIVFEIFILSFALGDKIRLMKSDKEKAQQAMIVQLKENEKLKDKVNQELEQKVSERTSEIIQQKGIIEKQNHELKSAYERLQEQSQEILRMNSLLNEENKVLVVQKEELVTAKEELLEEKNELEVNVKELNKARILMKDVDFSEFSSIFPDKDACMRYLVELKWKKGYKCIRCSNEKYFDGHESYSRRCTRCGYDESATAYTIFHRLRFPINKAFYMLFLIYSNKGKITSLELSQIVTLRQSTCWSFRKKVLEKMNQRKKNSGTESDGWSWMVRDE